MKNTSGIIIACVPSLVLLIMGYHGSRAVTKSSAIRYNKSDNNIEP